MRGRLKVTQMPGASQAPQPPRCPGVLRTSAVPPTAEVFNASQLIFPPLRMLPTGVLRACMLVRDCGQRVVSAKCGMVGADAAELA